MTPTPLGFVLLLALVLVGFGLGAVGDGSPFFRPDPVDDDEADRDADRWERAQWGDR